VRRCRRRRRAAGSTGISVSPATKRRWQPADVATALESVDASVRGYPPFAGAAINAHVTGRASEQARHREHLRRPRLRRVQVSVRKRRRAQRWPRAAVRPGAPRRKSPGHPRLGARRFGTACAAYHDNSAPAADGRDGTRCVGPPRSSRPAAPCTAVEVGDDSVSPVAIQRHRPRLALARMTTTESARALLRAPSPKPARRSA
jgi:hypothetical protein